MCSGGGMAMDVDLDEVKFNKYKCKDCDSTFKGAGKKPTCPSCGCEDVEQIE
jgi:rubrerythrin